MKYTFSVRGIMTIACLYRIVRDELNVHIVTVLVMGRKKNKKLLELNL